MKLNQLANPRTHKLILQMHHKANITTPNDI